MVTSAWTLRIAGALENVSTPKRCTIADIKDITASITDTQLQKNGLGNVQQQMHKRQKPASSQTTKTLSEKLQKLTDVAIAHYIANEKQEVDIEADAPSQKFVRSGTPHRQSDREVI